jgi:hypothetical protein
VLCLASWNQPRTRCPRQLRCDRTTKLTGGAMPHVIMADAIRHPVQRLVRQFFGGIVGCRSPGICRSRP